MNNFQFNDCRKAVNQATFRPTAERKAAAVKLLKEAMDFISSLEEVADKPSKKAGKKRRRKTTKRTPSQKVADRQERVHHGKADGVVKPSKKARKASVKEAAKAAKAVSQHTGAAQRAEKKAKLEAVAMPKAAPMEVTSADRVASLEAKVEALTAALAVHMESALPAMDAVSIDDVPFQL
jgi:hypothetical protein